MLRQAPAGFCASPRRKTGAPTPCGESTSFSPCLPGDGRLEGRDPDQRAVEGPPASQDLLRNCRTLSLALSPRCLHFVKSRGSPPLSMDCSAGIDLVFKKRGGATGELLPAVAGRVLGKTKRDARRPFSLLSEVVVTQRAIKPPASHAAFLEICVQNRRGRGRFFRVSQPVLCRREPPGKPRFTRVSEGYPRRRLLLKKLLSVALVRHGSLSLQTRALRITSCRLLRGATVSKEFCVLGVL